MTKKDMTPRGAIRTTSFDVAALAGVSQSVVSRAFKPGASIAGATREKVLDAARKLNYVPNSIASSLTTRRSKLVAVILGGLRDPFCAHVLDSACRELQDRGRQTLVFTVDDEAGADDAILRLLPYQVDGVILGSARMSARMVGMCHDRGIPVVLFNRFLAHSGAFGVRCDNEAGGRAVAEAFLSAGARSFAMITGDPDWASGRERARGFTDRLLDAGIPREAIRCCPCAPGYDGGTEAMRTLLGDGPGRPDAIFGLNDIMAMGAMDALRMRHGLRIPQDVMIAGFDDIREAAHLSYRLTTLRQPVGGMIREALDILNLDEPQDVIAPGFDRPVTGKLIWRDTIPGHQTCDRSAPRNRAAPPI